MRSLPSILTLVVVSATTVEAFAPLNVKQHHVPAVASRTQLAFGIPSFFTPKSDDDEEASDTAPQKEKKIGLSGIVQLITAGAGAPFLGDFEGVDEETGKFMFSLEASNLVDENGNSKQTQMPYFESGWVDPEDQAKADEKKGGFKFW
eukprot:CAMPEP_0172441122 /NCGR_PEP_ID=MMETSP1065-20121228/1693_1 /TAXON_ID=265537 /ORGANISM="Amphiprora paludosa, Strain CCMP125" /LENGTH=147 /DNA_ID=CAMNT_0013190315 /DNA_START=155 /DNA_END=598 /DNA_ORIENTATION=+